MSATLNPNEAEEPYHKMGPFLPSTPMALCVGVAPIPAADSWPQGWDPESDNLLPAEMRMLSS